MVKWILGFMLAAGSDCSLQDGEGQGVGGRIKTSHFC
jgi:hypothetical protein